MLGLIFNVVVVVVLFRHDGGIGVMFILEMYSEIFMGEVDVMYKICFRINHWEGLCLSENKVGHMDIC